MRLTISVNAFGNDIRSYQQGTSKKKRSCRWIEAFVFSFEVLNESKRKEKELVFRERWQLLNSGWALFLWYSYLLLSSLIVFTNVVLIKKRGCRANLQISTESWEWQIPNVNKESFKEGKLYTKYLESA